MGGEIVHVPDGSSPPPARAQNVYPALKTPTGNPRFPCMRGAGWEEGAPPACAGTEPVWASKLASREGVNPGLSNAFVSLRGRPHEGPGLRTRAHARSLGRAEPARGMRGSGAGL